MYSIPGLFPFNTRQNIMLNYRNLENWIIKILSCHMQKKFEPTNKNKSNVYLPFSGNYLPKLMVVSLHIEGCTQTSNSLSMNVLYIFSIARFLIDHLFLHCDVSSEIWLVKETERIFKFQPYVHLKQESSW